MYYNFTLPIFQYFFNCIFIVLNKFIIVAPGIVRNIDAVCGPVDIINCCTVTWDVSNCTMDTIYTVYSTV